MIPYRAAVHRERPIVVFGDAGKGWAMLGLGVALIVVAFIGSAALALFADLIQGPLLLLLAPIGVIVALKARWGSIELTEDRRAIVVKRRFLGIPRERSIPVQHVRGLSTHAAGFWTRGEPDWELRLLLTNGETITLLRAGQQSSLESTRRTLDAFLVTHTGNRGHG